MMDTWLNLVTTMHELAVTQSILDISLRHAQKVDAKRIVTINLVVGKYSSIVDDSIQFYWDMIAEGTIAQGAQLHFERVPAEMKCLECGHAFEPTDESFACPECLSPKVSISKGDEMRVESIDVE
jgi:hydrogenase nickel incorporation protein HypA/HybF